MILKIEDLSNLKSFWSLGRALSYRTMSDNTVQCLEIIYSKGTERLGLPSLHENGYIVGTCRDF